ncbi:MAG: AAA family ATPase [Thermodesulfobacteriota bacterium]|jgi:predicted AAA+ superfamily ATPase
MYKRPIYQTLLKRLREPRRFIQVLAGPRQVGKTVLVRQLMEALTIPGHYASADEPMLRDRAWVEQQWDLARLRTHSQQGAREALLILDEVQKVTQRSEVVKRLWDEDSAARRPLKVVLSGPRHSSSRRG